MSEFKDCYKNFNFILLVNTSEENIKTLKEFLVSLKCIMLVYPPCNANIISMAFRGGMVLIEKEKLLHQMHVVQKIVFLQ